MSDEEDRWKRILDGLEAEISSRLAKANVEEVTDLPEDWWEEEPWTPNRDFDFLFTFPEDSYSFPPPPRDISLDEYQREAMRTAPDSMQYALNNAALGLCGEAGEFADEVKKHLFHGHPIDEAYLERELGDILWYCALAAESMGKNLGEVAQSNLDKLRERYPEGFDLEKSQNRG